MSKTRIELTINGKPVEALVEPRTLLIHFLREQLNLTGAHIGCDTGHCGACTVDMDNMSVKSCMIFAVQADGASITTIEGMANPDGALSALQEGFRMMHGLQCGYCTPGMILARPSPFAGKPQSHRSRNPRRHFRQSLPLHRIRQYRQGDPICGRQDQPDDLVEAAQ